MSHCALSNCSFLPFSGLPSRLIHFHSAIQHFSPFTITQEFECSGRTGISTNQALFQQGIEDLIQNWYFISTAAAQVYFDRGLRSLVREGQQAGMATGQ